MLGRIFLLSALVASLSLASGEASAHGSNRDAAIAGVLIGAVIGGAIVANSRYAPPPVYIDAGPPPPPAVYYQPYPEYYQPYPQYYRPEVYYRPYPRYYRPYSVIITPHHKFKHHRHHRDYYRSSRW
ncbi:hypothetical protein [Pseudomonas cavernae]|uniref:hypothetical protein n=1 Tax=Pseudomonas cavernae TaxID=2320867 RepID=UPI0015AA39BD|nr:hypothetical protein [Pseudomonas cavernae]